MFLKPLIYFIYCSVKCIIQDCKKTSKFILKEDLLGMCAT